MTKKYSDDPRPILQRIKTIVPSLNDTVDLIKNEYSVAERLLKLMVLAHANLVEMGETLNQALLNSTDLAMAQETLVSDQKSSMKTLENLADRATIAGMITQNLDFWLRSDPDTVYHILEIVDLKVLAEAAGKLPASRLAEIIVAVQDAAKPGE